MVYVWRSVTSPFHHVSLADGTWLGRQSGLVGSVFNHQAKLTAPSLPFLNPILQLTKPQEILTKACTIT